MNGTNNGLVSPQKAFRIYAAEQQPADIRLGKNLPAALLQKPFIAADTIQSAAAVAHIVVQQQFNTCGAEQVCGLTETFSRFQIGLLTVQNRTWENKLPETVFLGQRDEVVQICQNIIRENMEIEILYEQYPYDRELLDGIYDLILEAVLCRSESICIASNEYPVQLVKSKFLKLNSSHIQYVMDCLKETTSKVRNIKKYLLAALFNAPTTIKSYYQQEVNHDFPQYACAR